MCLLFVIQTVLAVVVVSVGVTRARTVINDGVTHLKVTTIKQ